MSKYCVIETSINRLSWALRVAKYRGLIADISKKQKTKKLCIAEFIIIILQICIILKRGVLF